MSAEPEVAAPSPVGVGAIIDAASAASRRARRVLRAAATLLRCLRHVSASRATTGRRGCPSHARTVRELSRASGSALLLSCARLVEHDTASMRFDRAVYGNAMERGDASLQSVEFPRFPMPLHSACMSESEGMDIEVADPICESGGVSHRARPGMRPALCGCARRFSGDVGAAMRVVEHYRALEASLGAPQASSPRSSPEPEARRHEPEPEPVGYQSSRGSPSPCGSPRGGHEASPGAA